MSKRKSYVYAIGDADQKLVKIGVTVDPIRRLTFIQVTCPFDVSILWLEEGDAIQEDALHDRFANRRLRGEWFEFPDGDAVARLEEAMPSPSQPASLMTAFDFSPSRRTIGARVKTVTRRGTMCMPPDQVT